jgi:hypothetical protein
VQKLDEEKKECEKQIASLERRKKIDGAKMGKEEWSGSRVRK